MDPVASWLGTVLGHALRECLPELRLVIRDAVREAVTPSMEVSAPNPMRSALEQAVKKQAERMRAG